MSEFIQVGVTALRDPKTGDFLPAVPLYIEKTDEAKASADHLVEDIRQLLAARFAEYVRGTQREGAALP